MASPTARTLKWLRMEGWTAAVVERWIPQARKRKDCFGFDVLACKPETVLGLPVANMLGIQATSGSNHSSRKAKLLKNPDAANWLASCGRIEIWSWRQSKRGRKWELRREALTLFDFVPEVPRGT